MKSEKIGCAAMAEALCGFDRLIQALFCCEVRIYPIQQPLCFAILPHQYITWPSKLAQDAGG